MMNRCQALALALGFALAGRAPAADGGAAGRYTGTAVDDKGQPVAGAAVACYQDASAVAACEAQDFALKEHGTTDSKGGFTVAAGEGVTIVVVKKEGLAPGWKFFTAWSGESSDPVVLTAPTILAGVVVDEKGQPVADAEVWVSRAMPAPEQEGFTQGNMIAGQPARDCFSTRTSADGHFRIANFPAESQADLAVRKAGAGQRLRTHFAGTLAYSSDEEALKLTLPTPGNIEGRVTAGDTGQPLSGVKLRWLGWTGGLSQLDTTGPVLSGADGGFRIADAAPGMAAISAEFPGGPVADWVAERVSVTVSSGETKKDVQIRAVKGGVAVIKVVSHKDGEPVGGAIISTLSQTAQSVFTAETGVDGVARLRLPAGEWSIAAVKEGWDSGRAFCTVVTSRTNQVEAQISRSLKITGIVHDPAGAPVAGAIVSIVQNSVQNSGNNREITTDANGRYVIKWQMLHNFALEGDWAFSGGFGIPNYSILARSVERNLLTQHEIDETTTKLDLKLQPAVTLSVTVRDAQGLPLANAVGQAFAMNDNRGYSGPDIPSSKSDALGRFEFTGFLPADRYCTYVSAKGYGSVTAQMEAPWRRTNRIVFPPLGLAPANQKLAGKVLDPDGKPVPRANVTMRGEGQPAGNTTTDAEGRFAFDAVCEGPIQLYANSGVGGNFRNVNTQAQGGDTNVVIQFAVSDRPVMPRDESVTTSGRVLDPSGAPVSGANLSLGSHDGPSDTFGLSDIFGSPFNGNTARSEEDGTYSITWVKPNYSGPQPPIIYVRDSERHLAATHDLDSTKTNLDLCLQEALTLSIKVQDATGKPVPTAVAYVYDSSATGWVIMFSPDRANKANDQGVIEFKDLPQGRRYSATITAPGYGPATLLAQADETKTNHFDFPILVLKAADRKVAGQVLDPNGKPVDRATVSTVGEGQPGGYTTTDDQGRFALFGVCEGPLQLQVSTRIPGLYALSSMDGNTRAQGGDTNVVIRLAINDQANAQMATLSGKVFDPSGAPVAGMRLSVAPSYSVNQDVRSDDDGHYSISWHFGNGRNPYIYIRDVENNLAVSQDIDENTTKLDLRLQEGLTLSARAQDAKGQPVPTATADLRTYVGDMEFSFNRPPARADDQGLIEMRGLPPGRRYRLIITAKGFGTADVRVLEAETKTNHFDFPPVVIKEANRKLGGQVLGPDSKPAAGAHVNMQPDGQPAGGATTDVQGRFVFAAVCEGPVQLYVNTPTGVGPYGFKVPGGDTNLLLRLGPPNGVPAAAARPANP